VPYRTRDRDAFTLGKPFAQELGHEAMVAHARSVRLSGKRTVQTSGLPSLVDECIGDYALIEIVWLGDWNEAH